jgi:cation diffusion facilitator CzcD-associated flavoprotein CzcO
VYQVTLKDTVSGEETSSYAEIIIWAIGGFAAPLYPKDIRGTEKFKGLVWHSARWRHDVNLKGKRVAVIGNGCSAAQFIPEISEDPSVHVVNFCRTPQWFFPRVRRPFFHRVYIQVLVLVSI